MTLPTALREMEISSSVGATDLDMFPHHNPNMDLVVRESSASWLIAGDRPRMGSGELA